MKKEIYLSLDQFADRPVFDLPEHTGLTALLDTGARFPVWTASVKVLLALDAKLVKKDVEYSGVGGTAKGDIYRIPSLIIGTCTNALTFPRLPVITSEDFQNAPFGLILSNTMFRNLEFTVNDKLHSLIFRIPDDETDVRNAIVNLDDGFQVLFTGA